MTFETSEAMDNWVKDHQKACPIDYAKKKIKMGQFEYKFTPVTKEVRCRVCHRSILSFTQGASLYWRSL